MNNFYITLPSDSSMQYFPSNTVTHFRTHLSEKIDLRGRWVVGLSEIKYPHSWFNVDAHCYVLVRTKNFKTVLTLTPGFYETVTSIIDELPLQNYAKDVKVNLRPTTNKVAVTFKGTEFDLAFSLQLGLLLGFKPDSYVGQAAFEKRVHNNWWPDTHPHVATVTSDINRIEELFVYSDIIEPQFVGHLRIPLLRSIKTKRQHGELHQKIFQKPDYLALKTNSFQTIEIDIRDALGHPVAFQFGRCTVKLHFKRILSEYLL